MSDLDPALLSDLPQRRQRIPLEQHSQSLILQLEAVIPEADLGQRKVERRGSSDGFREEGRQLWTRMDTLGLTRRIERCLGCAPWLL